jgi:hypothetical protein
LHALPVFGEAVVGLVDAGAKSCNGKWPWVGCALEKELVFLAAVRGGASLLRVVLKVAMTPKTR